jgi:hypothetical protein
MCRQISEYFFEFLLGSLLILKEIKPSLDHASTIISPSTLPSSH